MELKKKVVYVRINYIYLEDNFILLVVLLESIISMNKFDKILDNNLKVKDLNFFYF